MLIQKLFSVLSVQFKGRYMIRFCPIGLVFGLILGTCTSVFAEDAGIKKLGRREMKLGRVYEIRTKDDTGHEAIYHARVKDVLKGETRMTEIYNGVTSKPHTVYIVGCGQGRQPNDGGLTLVFMWEIRVGLKMELGVNTMEKQDRRYSGEVTSIRLLPDEVLTAQR
jgi:hypothetical protein